MQSKTLLVFPTSRAIRTYIAQDSSNRLLSSTLSINELFTKSISIGDFRYCDDEHRFLYLKEATKNTKLEQLGISNSFSDFIKQSDYLFRFFGEISAENIAFSEISNADTYDFYGEHLRILESICNNYCEILEKNLYVDKINLPTKYSLNQDFLQQFDEIVVHFHGYFTHFEFSLLLEISKVVRLKIELQTNKYNKKSCEKFINLGFDLKDGFYYILDISSKTILEKSPIKKKEQTIDIKAFSQRVYQTAFVRSSVVNMINSGLSANEIVVIVPNEEFAKSFELFDVDGYFNYAMGKDIQNSKLYKSANSIFNYLSNNEQKNRDHLNFLNLDIEYIDKNIKPFWSKNITKELFEDIIDFIKQTENSREILEKYEELIYSMQKTIFNYNDAIKTSEFFKFLLQKLELITIDDANGYAISILGLLETRAVSYKGVIVVDFNEGYVPKPSIKDKFLSTKVKIHSKLPTKEDRENLQKYYYNHLFENAEHISISYVKNSTSNISRFANELFSIDLELETSDKLYEDMLFTKKEFAHNLEDIVCPFDLSKFEWSATSLKTYLECKRRFYYKYISKLDEHHFSVKPQGFEIGDIIHKILEEFYKTNKALDCSTQNNILNSYFEKMKQTNPFLILDLEIWKNRFEEFIKLEKLDFEQKRKSVYKTELPFKFQHNGITLKGVIDRVDKGDSFFEIIDYKTSSSLKVDTLKNCENSKDFQLEFYYLAMSEYAHKNGYNDYQITPYYYKLSTPTLLEEVCIDEKVVLLEKKLEEFKKEDKTINFEMAQNKSSCTFCAYQTICNK